MSYTNQIPKYNLLQTKYLNLSIDLKQLAQKEV